MQQLVVALVSELAKIRLGLLWWAECRRVLHLECSRATCTRPGSHLGC